MTEYDTVACVLLAPIVGAVIFGLYAILWLMRKGE
jgi:hypothetical protein